MLETTYLVSFDLDTDQSPSNSYRILYQMLETVGFEFAEENAFGNLVTYPTTIVIGKVTIVGASVVGLREAIKKAALAKGIVMTHLVVAKVAEYGGFGEIVK